MDQKIIKEIAELELQVALLKGRKAVAKNDMEYGTLLNAIHIQQAKLEALRWVLTLNPHKG